MKKVGTVAFLTLLFVCALGAVLQIGSAQERNPTGGRQRPEAGDDKQKSQMPTAQKLTGWKGEKVTILGTQPLSCPFIRGSQVFFRKPGSDERDFLPYDKYAGQTG